MHFLSAADFSKRQFEDVFSIVDTINTGRHLSLGGLKTLAIFFESANSRERVSLEVAMAMLNGKSMYVGAVEAGANHDAAKFIAGAEKQFGERADIIAASMLHHSDLAAFAKSSKIPVINVLTDLERPVQALTDVYTIAGFKGGLKNIRIACLGDIAMNSVNSLMLAATKLGAEISLVGPASILPNDECVNYARKHGSVEISEDMEEGMAGAEVVYTDASGSDKQRAAKRPRALSRYQLNARTLGYANRDAIVMHPMPAFRGSEITAEVIDGKKSVVWKETKNKVHVEQALIKYLADA